MDEQPLDDLLAKMIKPATTSTAWSNAGHDVIGDVRRAMQQIRDAPYPIPCGYEGNPHVVHPREAPRIMPWDEWSALGDAKWNVPLALCANCGEPLPMLEA
jgi:hypothetical protein